LKHCFSAKNRDELPEMPRHSEKSGAALHIMQVRRLFVGTLRGRSEDHLRHASFGTKRNFGRF
tara:strand:- start:417 stop:605 length:189 start_codon:yes stop_codon:yes gene_type:complete